MPFESSLGHFPVRTSLLSLLQAHEPLFRADTGQVVGVLLRFYSLSPPRPSPPPLVSKLSINYRAGGPRRRRTGKLLTLTLTLAKPQNGRPRRLPVFYDVGA